MRGLSCGRTAAAATRPWRTVVRIARPSSARAGVDGNALVCPYHGWAYDGSGTCVRVPTTAGLRRIERHCRRDLRLHRTLWAMSGWRSTNRWRPFPTGTRRATPAIAESTSFYEPWNCAGFRLMENSFDNAPHPLRPSPDVRQHQRSQPTAAHHRALRSRLRRPFPTSPVFNTELQKKKPARRQRLHRAPHHGALVHALSCVACKSATRTALDHIIVTAATPIADGSCQVVQFCFRNDTEAQATGGPTSSPSTGRVTEEDREVLEGTDFDVPLDMNSGVERHMPSDQPGLLMRRMLLELLAAHGETEQTRHCASRAGGRSSAGGRATPVARLLMFIPTASVSLAHERAGGSRSRRP